MGDGGGGSALGVGGFIACIFQHFSNAGVSEKTHILFSIVYMRPWTLPRPPQQKQTTCCSRQRLQAPTRLIRHGALASPMRVSSLSSCEHAGWSVSRSYMKCVVEARACIQPDKGLSRALPCFCKSTGRCEKGYLRPISVLEAKNGGRPATCFCDQFNSSCFALLNKERPINCVCRVYSFNAFCTRVKYSLI